MDLASRFKALGLRPVMGQPHPIVMDVSELKAFEQQLGVRLPETYRQFLLTCGASGFASPVKFRPCQLLPTAISASGEDFVAIFYGPRSAIYEDEYSLWANLRIYAARMPENLIPIADDGGGNQICLGIRGEEAGKVYYWDHEHEWDEEDYLEQGLPVPPDLKFQNVYRIADSFEDFIARLYVVEV